MTLVEQDACCNAGASTISDEDAARRARLFKALGDPVRMKLLAIIASSTGHEACICDLEEPVGLSQGTVSHHMKILTEAGFVTREQRGKWAYFSISEAGFASARQSLNL